MEASTHYLFLNAANFIKKYVAWFLYCAKSVPLLFVSADTDNNAYMLLY